MAPVIATLTAEINTLFLNIKTQKRLLFDERLKLGKLLVQLRAQFGVVNTKGTFRGSHKGGFCTYVAQQGWNLGTCYNYIDLAEGKKPTQVREAYWQVFNRKMKKVKTPAQKLALVRAAVAYILKLYKIKAIFTVTAK